MGSRFQFCGLKLWPRCKDFHNHMGVPIGCPGSGKLGIIKNQDDLTVLQNEIPFAMQYLDCSGNINAVCKEHEYNATCWIDHPGFAPSKKQDNHRGGRAGRGRNKGWKRNVTFVVKLTNLPLFLRLASWQQASPAKRWRTGFHLSSALVVWIESKKYQLLVRNWHITEEYHKTRRQIEEHLDKGECLKSFEKHGLSDLCKLPIKARTEFTLRAYASISSIRTLMPPAMLKNINPSESSVYDGPDVFNPSLHPPPGAVNVLSIVEAGPTFQAVLVPQYSRDYYKKPKFKDATKVPVGKGAYLDTYVGDYYCDGSVDSWCDRGEGQACLLQHHNDDRNGIKFDGYSGWDVMNLPDVLHGLIVIKVEMWHPKENIQKTKGWTSINNEGESPQRHLRHSAKSRNITNTGSNVNKSSALERQLRKNQPQPIQAQNCHQRHNLFL